MKPGQSSTILRSMMNTLVPEDVEKLWIPKIVYSNTKENENIKERLTEVSVTVKRESSFSIGGMDIVDETHIFEGRDNHLNLGLHKLFHLQV